MKTVLIKCKNEDQFNKIKFLIEPMGGTTKWTDNDSYRIECVFDEKVVKYIKRKWTVSIVEI